MLILKTKRIRDRKHLDWLKTLPCCVSGRVGNIDPAHIRKGSGAGAGQKPCDSLAVPLYHWLHHEQHQIGEMTFWDQYGGIEKAKKLARDLYAVSGDTQAALKLLREFRK